MATKYDEKTKETITKYLSTLSAWISTEKLEELPSFDILNNARKAGDFYKRDQEFFESVADHKTKLLGIRALLMTLTINADRVTSSSINSMLETVEHYVRLADNVQAKAKQRLKFYDNVFYVFGNPTYGAY